MVNVEHICDQYSVDYILNIDVKSLKDMETMFCPICGNEIIEPLDFDE